MALDANFTALLITIKMWHYDDAFYAVWFISINVNYSPEHPQNGI